MDVIERVNSLDGGCKYLLSAGGREKTVEATYFYHGESRLPYLCISSQFGCAVGCLFCETGRQKSLGNLDASQIVRQVEVCSSELMKEGSPRLDTVLFAGMGEPMLNLTHVRKASLDLKARGMANRVTLTTAGILSRFDELYDIPLDTLSISLHATTDEIRKKLMPGVARYRIEDLMEHAASYRQRTGVRVILNYILLKNINDRDEDLKRLAEIIPSGIFSIKLKRLNDVSPVAGLFLSTSDEFGKFFSHLTDAGFDCIVDIGKGTDVLGGCGQLRSRFRTLRTMVASVSVRSSRQKN